MHTCVLLAPPTLLRQSCHCCLLAVRAMPACRPANLANSAGLANSASLADIPAPPACQPSRPASIVDVSAMTQTGHAFWTQGRTSRKCKYVSKRCFQMCVQNCVQKCVQKLVFLMLTYKTDASKSFFFTHKISTKKIGRQFWAIFRKCVQKLWFVIKSIYNFWTPSFGHTVWAGSFALGMHLLRCALKHWT